MLSDISRLLELPTELWQMEIASYLAPIDIAKFTLASKQLRQILLPILLRTIYLREVFYLHEQNHAELCRAELGHNLQHCRVLHLSIAMRDIYSEKNGRYHQVLNDRLSSCASLLKLLLRVYSIRTLALRFHWSAGHLIASTPAKRLIAKLMTVVQAMAKTLGVQVTIQAENMSYLDEAVLEDPDFDSPEAVERSNELKELIERESRVSSRLLRDVTHGVWNVVSLELKGQTILAPKASAAELAVYNTQSLRRLRLVSSRIPDALLMGQQLGRITELQLCYGGHRLEDATAMMAQTCSLLQNVPHLQKLKIYLCGFDPVHVGTLALAPASWALTCRLGNLLSLILDDTTANPWLNISHNDTTARFLIGIQAPKLSTISLNAQMAIRALRNPTALLSKNFPSLRQLDIHEGVSDFTGTAITSDEFRDFQELSRVCGDMAIVLKSRIYQRTRDYDSYSTVTFSDLDAIYQRMGMLSTCLVEVNIVVRYGGAICEAEEPLVPPLLCPLLRRFSLTVESDRTLAPVLLCLDLPGLQTFQLSTTSSASSEAENIVEELIRVLQEEFIRAPILSGQIYIEAKSYGEDSELGGDDIRQHLHKITEKLGIENRVEWLETPDRS